MARDLSVDRVPVEPRHCPRCKKFLTECSRDSVVQVICRRCKRTIRLQPDGERVLADAALGVLH